MRSTTPERLALCRAMPATGGCECGARDETLRAAAQLATPGSWDGLLERLAALQVKTAAAMGGRLK